MKELRGLLCLAALMLIFPIMTGCSQKDSGNEPSVLPEEQASAPETHRWYYFTRDGFEETDIPRLTPKATVKPWTEAARISSAATTDDAAFFTANRRGLLVQHKDGSLELKTDSRFFQEETVGSLFIDEGNPVFHLYRNDYFNMTDSQHDVAMPVIAEYNLTTDVFYPVLYRDELSMTETQEVTDISVTDDVLTLSIKDTGKRTSFTYYDIIFPSTFTDTAASARNRTLDGHILSQEEYQKKYDPAQFGNAPQRLRQLLQAIPDSFSYSIKVQSANGHNTPKTYLHGFSADEVPAGFSEAYAVLGTTWTIAVFPDGTSYFSGALPDRHILNNGATICFSLPSLPKGFIYTVFAAAGDFLTVGWEESGMYQTGTAGFLVVDLAKVLY